MAFPAGVGPSGPARSTCTAEPHQGSLRLEARAQIAPRPGCVGESWQKEPGWRQLTSPLGRPSPLLASKGRPAPSSPPFPSSSPAATRTASASSGHVRAPGWDPPRNLTEQPPPHSRRCGGCAAPPARAPPPSAPPALRAPSPAPDDKEPAIPMRQRGPGPSSSAADVSATAMFVDGAQLQLHDESGGLKPPSARKGSGEELTGLYRISTGPLTAPSSGS